MSRHTIASIKLGTAVINQIEESSLDPQLSKIILAGSGQADPTFIGVSGASPRLNFSTTAINTALTNLGGNIGAAISASNFSFWMQQLSQAGLRTSGSTHIKGTIVSGYIVPLSLRASNKMPVSISYLVIALSADGTSSPISITTAQALDVSQAGAEEAYTLGVVTINGSAIDGNADVNINFGINPLVDGGLAYPTFAGCMSRRPTITISARDMDTFASWGILGTNRSAATTIVLDDVVNGGVRGSDPITFSVNEGRMNFQDLSGRQDSPYEGQIIINPVFDGTNDPIAISLPA